MTPLIPICFYPMRKIVLDDDEAFTQSILLKMQRNHFTAYESPQYALNYLLQEYHPTLNKADLIDKNASVADSSTQHIINIDIEKVRNLFIEPSHSDINVILVDYHMPEMHGIEFLQEINHLPIKKALITGENDYKIAVDAFNAGLVDAYLRKDDKDFSFKIKKIISELEWKYFTELSGFISDVQCFSYLKNKNFYEQFKQHIETNDVVSFCMTNVHGDFITKNRSNEQTNILIRDKEQLQTLSIIAEEDGGSQSTIESLKQGKVIPFFDSLESWQLPASEWDNFLYPAAGLGDSNLVWAKIDS